MEIPQKMLELSAIAFSPMKSINLSMKRKFSSNGHHYRPHLTSASSDISSEEQPHADECEDEDDDSRASSTVVGNGDLVKTDAKLTSNITLPSPPSSTRSSFDNDGVTRDSFISSGDNSENVTDAGLFGSFVHHNMESDVVLEGQNEQGVSEQACNADAFEDEIKLVAENLVNMVAQESEKSQGPQDADDDPWRDLKIDLEGETILPSGLRVVNGVAEMPFFHEDDTEPPRFTNQLSYLKTMLTKYLCRYKTAAAFLNPVDSVRYKIPHYYLVIRQPMDLNTVKNRINFLWYRNADECISDMRLILSNCFKFNSPTDFVYKSGKKLEEYIEERLRDLPAVEVEVPCPPRPSLEEFQKFTTKKVVAVKQRADSISELSENGDSSARGVLTPGLIKMTTRSERGVMVRKPSKDLPTPLTASTPQPKAPSSKKVPLNEALKFCLDFVRELFNKKHAEYAWPFWQAVNLRDYPDYLQKIKRPVDLSSIKTNIETGKYLTVHEFASDMRLMFSNCLRYNKPESPIIEQARKLRDIFEYKYARLPEEWLHEKLVIQHTSSSNDRTTSPSVRSSSASTSSKHPTGDSHKSVKIKPYSENKTPKARNSVDNSGQSLVSPVGGINTPSTSAASETRMELLERQVAHLTSALKVCLGGGGVNENARNALLSAMLPVAMPANATPATNGKRPKGRPRKNGLTPSTSTGKAPAKKQTASSKKRKRHLSSDEDSDSDDEADQLSNVTEPFDAGSIQDLAKLKNDLENLRAKDLKMVLEILQSSEPEIPLDSDTNIEIDFESLKPKTLIALRKFVTSVMLNIKPNRSASTSKPAQPPTTPAANSSNKRLCLSNSLGSVSNINTDCDNSTINNWSRAGSRASDLQLSEESSSDSELD